jgi:hypothetical protein
VQRKTAGWVATAGASVLITFLLTDAFLAPSAHDIHSPGGVSIRIQIADSDTGGFARGYKPSQSLADVRCQVWRTYKGDPCPDDATAAQLYWPRLTQSPKTLYMTWSPCGQYSNYPVATAYYGFNVEYLDSKRTMIIHCYQATPWIHGPGAPGANATLSFALLLIPTEAIPAGRLSVVQDDRVEHLFGDQSSEYQIATATIS